MLVLLIALALVSQAAAECCSGNGDAMCTCDDGWSGDYCDTATTYDYCAMTAQYLDGNPNMTVLCGDHGTCFDTGSSANCTCDDGYYGDFCQFMDDVVVSKRCYSEPLTSGDYIDGVEVGCDEDGYYCMPENWNCMVSFLVCDDPIGWCRPLDESAVQASKKFQMVLADKGFMSSFATNIKKKNTVHYR